MTDDVDYREWFTWRQRNRLLSEMRECGCPKRAVLCSNAVALLEALYPRRRT